ncbi:MAG: PP2C family protein-serine/threonine phosphatase [Anaerolineae bacterium]|nr:PP2C family protein-serine/threonine phosphatase [Anaerolineae bacterium]
MNENIIPFLIAFQLAVFGIVLLLAATIRRRSRERILFLAGLLMLIYGLEKMIFSSFTPFSFDGEFPTLLLWFRAIWLPGSLVLGTLLVKDLTGSDRHGPIQWIFIITVGYTVVSLAADITVGSPMTLERSRQGITIVWAIVMLVYLFRYQQMSLEVSILRIGLLLVLVTVINDNLVNLSIVPWAVILGPYGFLMFAAALGIIAVLRFLHAEKKLVLLEAEIQAASMIQLSILPDNPPTGHDANVAARYLPMARVGGDFYDFLIVDKNRLGILIADVSGHGLSAAMIASMVKMAVAAQHSNASDPAKVLYGINQALFGKIKDKYVTGAYVFIDTSENTIRYAGAGHPAMLVLRQNGPVVEEVEENGLILGLFREAEYTSVDIAMNDNDTLVLYTDGITEAEDENGEMFGLEGLKRCVVEHAHSSVVDVSDAILNRVHSWTNGKSVSDPDDDITLIIARFRANPKIVH